MKLRCKHAIMEVVITLSRIPVWSILIPVIFLMLSCSTTSYREVYPILMDGKYDSEFPYRSCSKQLEQISETVRMINCIAYYKSHVFPIEAQVRLSDIQSQFVFKKAIKEVYLNRSSGGSATIIHYNNKRVALLTCAHVVEFPDTVVTFFVGDNYRLTEFISSVAVKDRQTNYIASLSGIREFNILAVDSENDLALVGNKFEVAPTFRIPVFEYPLGKAKELEWGAFVYLFGYPSGRQIITKGVVSDPNRDGAGSFLMDAVFNKGFSGGIVLAVRDGVPNFELVGMVRTVWGHSEYYLGPTKESENIDFDAATPYKGDMYIKTHTEIEYGITQAASAESIIAFLKQNKQALLEKGYDLRPFMEKQSAISDSI